MNYGANIIKETSNGYDLIRIQDEMLTHREIELVGEIDDQAVNALIRELRYPGTALSGTPGPGHRDRDVY